MNKDKVKKNKSSNKFFKILEWMFFIFFLGLTIILIVNVIKLANIENLIRIIVCLVLGLIYIILFLFRNKKPKLIKVIMFILSLGYIFLNYNFYKVYSSLDNITTVVDTKTLYLLTSNKELDDINDLDDGDIGIMSSSINSEFYEMAEDMLKDNKLNNKLLEYEDYIQIINALLNNEIEYAFLPENYESIYNASNGEDIKELDFKILHKVEKKITSKKNNKVDLGSLTEPFSILLIGTDIILDSYNADTLMLVTVNPKTLQATMLSIPRDTYTKIACTGGKHKINASGWYGDKCVVDTVGEYLDIDIDYYAKINFFGMVELVDALGGVEVDVPYALCEQNSKRQFGKNMIFVESGVQTLNGEQALALSRNRHYWKDMCPSKYTSDGDRSDITRGKNQQLVIQAVLNKLMSVRDLNKVYKILDIVGDNMSTNMSKETIFSFYDVFKDILGRLGNSSVNEVVNVKRLTFKSYSTSIYLSGLQLSMIVNYDESIKYNSLEMKKNLGLVKRTPVKTFSFDINNSVEDEIKQYNTLSSSLQLLPNFVGKSWQEVVSYCNNKGLKCEISNGEINGLVVSQSVSYNTDVSTIRGKSIMFELEGYGTNKKEAETDNVLNTDTDNEIKADDVIDDVISDIIGGEVVEDDSSNGNFSSEGTDENMDIDTSVEGNTNEN